MTTSAMASKRIRNPLVFLVPSFCSPDPACCAIMRQRRAKSRYVPRSTSSATSAAERRHSSALRQHSSARFSIMVDRPPGGLLTRIHSQVRRIHIAYPPLAEFHHRAGIFSLSFQGLVAAGMRSCKPKNRTACANKNEYRGRVLRGSDRSAHSRPSPNCCFGQVIRKSPNNYGRSSQAPRRAPEHVRSMTCGPSTRRQHQH
jgi:hypothetical protein